MTKRLSHNHSPIWFYAFSVKINNFLNDEKMCLVENSKIFTILPQAYQIKEIGELLTFFIPRKGKTFARYPFSKMFFLVPIYYKTINQCDRFIEGDSHKIIRYNSCFMIRFDVYFSWVIIKSLRIHKKLTISFYVENIVIYINLLKENFVGFHAGQKLLLMFSKFYEDRIWFTLSEVHNEPLVCKQISGSRFLREVD